MCCQPSPRVIRSWALLFALPALAGAALTWLCLLYFLPKVALPVAGLWLAAVAVAGSFWLPLRRKRLHYSLTEEAITVSGGVVFTACHRMPLEAVRHVTRLEGPLERLSGIVFLSVSGLGGHLLLEGLEREQADAWCHRLLPDA